MLWINRWLLKKKGKYDAKYGTLRIRADGGVISPFTEEELSKFFEYQEQVWFDYGEQTAELRKIQADLVSRWNCLSQVEKTTTIPSTLTEVRQQRYEVRLLKEEQAERQALYQEITSIYTELKHQEALADKCISRQREECIQRISAYIQGILLYEADVYFDTNCLKNEAEKERFFASYQHLDKVCETVVRQEVNIYEPSRCKW